MLDDMAVDAALGQRLMTNLMDLFHHKSVDTAVIVEAADETWRILLGPDQARALTEALDEHESAYYGGGAGA
jgi:hypothetical protein